MRRFLPLLAALLLPLHALGQDLPPSVSFKTEKATYKVGEEIKGTVTATFEPGLHGYQNPPSKDYMLPVAVKPGEGTVLKAVSYPKGHFEMAGGEEAAVYSGTVSFPVVISAPTGKGKVKLNLGFFYQQCDAQSCYMPATIPVSAEVTIEAAALAPPDTGQPDGPSGERKIEPASAQWNLVQPLEPVVVSTPYEIKVRIQPGPRLFFFIPEGERSAFTLNDEPVDPAQFSFVRRTVAGISGWALEGNIETVVSMTAPPAPGKEKVKVKVRYTQADANNVYRATEFTGIHDVEFVASQGESILSLPDKTSTYPPEEEAQKSDDGLLGFLNKALKEGNWALIIPAALLTGLALCLTPCVFPMIPVTVSFFSNQGSQSTAGRLSLGLFFALGITITYGAVGGVSAAAGGFVGELFTKPWFVLALAALLIALALSMFDLYEIRLPGFISKNLKGRSGPVGALIMGVLMGFAAAPCAGALVGAVAVKVAEIGSMPTGIGMFSLIGLGMGLPFMVLATASSGAKGLPKSGGWLKTTKAVLGLVVLYFAASYVFQGFGMKPEAATTQIGWMVVFGGFAAYLLFFDKSDATRAVGMIKGVTCVALGLLAGMAYSEYGKIKMREALGATATGSQVSALGIDWIPYNDANFAKAVASGKPIMIDGKADWCVQCREIEHGVFLKPEGLNALRDVYLLSVDWSTGVPQSYIDETKKRFNITGLPNIVFMSAGGKNEFTVKDIKSVEELKGHLRRAGASL